MRARVTLVWVLVLVAAAMTLVGCGGSSPSTPVPGADRGLARPARRAAVAWVRALQAGDLRAACRLETARAVGTTSCRSLEPVSYACQAIGPGRPVPRVPARRAARQLGRLTVRGDRAVAKLRSERRSVAGTLATVALRRPGREWRVDSLLRDGRALDVLRLSRPEGGPETRAATDLYGKLFLGGCVKPIFG